MLGKATGRTLEGNVKGHNISVGVAVAPDAVILNDTPDGRFPHHSPNPLKAEAREQLAAAVRGRGLDCGVIFDGDADRAMFVDENGAFLPPDYLIPVVAETFSEKGTVIYDVRTSRAAIERLKADGSYDPRAVVASNPRLARALNHLIDGSLPTSDGSRFEDLFYALCPDGGWGDPYYVMLDFAPYDERFFDAIKAYQDRDRWLTSAVINTAKAGYFSSDRSIEDYNTHIWHLR